MKKQPQSHTSQTGTPGHSARGKKRTDGGKPGYVPIVFGAAAIIAAILIVYAQTFAFDFSGFDDGVLVRDNYPILSSIGNAGLLFRSDVFLGKAVATFYRPVQMLSYMIDSVVLGATPASHHVGNVLLHAAMACSVLALLLLLDVRKGSALLLTGWFALHPFLTQSVCWIPSRGDLLLGLFSVLAVIFLLLFVKKKYTWAFIPHVLFVAAALFSKESGAALPVVLLAYGYVTGALRERRSDWIMPAGAWGVALLVWFLMRGAVVQPPAGGSIAGVAALLRNSPALLEGLGKLAVPWDIAPIPAFTATGIIIGAIGVAALFGQAVSRGVLREPLFLFGVAWFVLFLLPGMWYRVELGSAAYDYLAHRFYLPVVGLCIAVAASLPRNARGGTAALAFGAVFVVGFGSYAYFLAKNYANPETFYTYAIRTNGGSALAYSNRGDERVTRGEYQAALADINMALGIVPRYPYALSNRADIYNKIGRFADAVTDCDKAIALFPEFAKAFLNRGFAYVQMHDLEKADADLSRAIALRAEMFDAYNNRGLVRNARGDYKGALADFDKTLALNPSFASAYNNRSMVRWSCLDTSGALGDLSSAIRFNPSFAKAYANRGIINVAIGHYREGIEDCSEALRYAPTTTVAYMQRGWARKMSGDLAGAVADWQAAARLGEKQAVLYLQSYAK